MYIRILAVVAHESEVSSMVSASVYIIIGSVVSVVVLCFIVLFVTIVCCRRRRGYRGVVRGPPSPTEQGNQLFCLEGEAID